jgi:hypothetical protein
VYTEAEAAIVRHAQRLVGRVVDLLRVRGSFCLIVGLAQVTYRFDDTFLPEVDDYFVQANEQPNSGVGRDRSLR